MKKLLAIAALVFLGGCSTVVPVTTPWPDPPGMQATLPCARLQQLPPDPLLSQVAVTVARNYDEYWNCSIKLDAWIEWYQKQSAIHKGFK